MSVSETVTAEVESKGRKTAKKKVNNFSRSECMAEILRLENAGDNSSKYYMEIKAQLDHIKYCK